MQSIDIPAEGCGGSIFGCFPLCSADQFGWFLKVRIAGRDGTMMMCNIERGVYGWGALGSTATGYFGLDPSLFFAAVNTGAAGTYQLDLGANANFTTAFVVGLGQSVVITGDPNSPAPLAWGTGSFEVKEGGALAMSYLALTADNKITLDEGARAVALTDCALNFAAEGLFAGGGAAAGTSNTCPEVPHPDNADPIVYDSADAWRRTAATVSCDHGRGAGTVVADPTVVRACRADGSWSAANPSCEPCCGCSGGSCSCSSCCGSSCCGGSCGSCGCSSSCSSCDLTC